MFLWILFCLVVVGTVEANSLPKKTNIQLSMTKKALNYANQVFIDTVVDEIEGLKTDTFSKSFVGTTLYLLSPQVESVVLNSSSISFDAGEIKVDVLLKSAMVTGKYKYSFGWFGSYRGSFVMTLEGVAVSTKVALRRTDDGKPKLINSGCNTKIQNAKTAFKGGSSWLLNAGSKLLKTYVKKNVEKKICQAIVNTIDKRSATYSSEYTKDFSIAQVPCASLRYKILEDPLVKDYYANIILEGKVNSSCYPTKALTNKQATRLAPPKTNKMVTMALSDVFINSMLNLYHQAGLMTATLNIAAKSQSKVPSIVQVTIALTHPPAIQTTINGSTITIKANASINTAAMSRKVHLLKGALVADGQLILEGRNKSLSGKLRNVRIQSSDAKVKPFIEDISSAQINKAFHEVLNNMIVLPFVSTFVMDNPTIVRSQGQTILETDIKM